MLLEHSMSCPYPEGCNCGASNWNKLQSDLNWYRLRFELLEKNKDKFREPELKFLCYVVKNGKLPPELKD